MAEKDEFGAFLLGFLVGGLTGAVTALLLAPQSGEETRNVIREKAIELSDKASSTIEDAYSQAESAAIEARARFDELAKTTRDRAEELTNKGQVVLEEQKTKISEAISKTGKKVAKDDAEQKTAEAA